MDIFSEPNVTFRPKTFNNDDSLQRYKSIRYVQNIELRFKLSSDKHDNKIGLPIMILSYKTIDSSKYNNNKDLYVNFSFKVSFVKQHNLTSAFQVS